MNVAVIGAGWAGCAAAVALADAGRRVTLYEAASALGGRARTLARDGFALDNGQHLLLGAYTATTALIHKVHSGSAPLVRRPLAVSPLAVTQPDAIALRAAALPAPYGFAAGLMRARGLTLRERAAVLRIVAQWRRAGFRAAPQMTVSALLAPMPARAVRGLWGPLCVAALNTPVERAAASAFLAVLRATFDAGADAADLVLPAGTLGEALPDAAARWLTARGHAVIPNATVAVQHVSDRGVEVEARGARERFDALVVAVGPHQLERALGTLDDAGEAAAALRIAGAYAYESITTVYLGYRGTPVAVPEGLVRLDDRPGQWLFERRDILRAAAHDAPPLDQLFAVVISTSGPHDERAHPDLARDCDAQLRRGRPRLPPLAWSRVIAERRATYACTPDAAHPGVRLARGLYLAGDYVYGAFPATLEAAVRSGEVAAAALLSDADRTA